MIDLTKFLKELPTALLSEVKSQLGLKIWKSADQYLREETMIEPEQ